MKNLRNMWFDSMCDLISEAEVHTMNQEKYLELVKQLEIARGGVLQLVSEDNKALCKEQLDRMEAYMTEMYNILLKNAVIAVEFKEIDL